jgi:hypothetical protein
MPEPPRKPHSSHRAFSSSPEENYVGDDERRAGFQALRRFLEHTQAFFREPPFSG